MKMSLNELNEENFTRLLASFLLCIFGIMKKIRETKKGLLKNILIYLNNEASRGAERLTVKPTGCGFDPNSRR